MGRVLVIEHDVTCPPALFGTWLEDAGSTVALCRPYAGDPVPPLEGHDALVVLGGPMAATDPHPWLAQVCELVRAAAANGVPTLGICLGHQLCGLALGGLVEPNPRGQQLGLLDVRWTDAAAGDPLLGSLSAPRRAVQWNDDLVTRIPEGAVALAVTPHGEVQAARFAPTVWGVQWHPEADRQVVTAWARSDAERHRAAGIDQQRLLDEIDASAAELEESWRPLAEGFCDVVDALARTRR